jgi:hypothetical protein
LRALRCAYIRFSTKWLVTKRNAAIRRETRSAADPIALRELLVRPVVGLIPTTVVMHEDCMDPELIGFLKHDAGLDLGCQAEGKREHLDLGVRESFTRSGVGFAFPGIEALSVGIACLIHEGSGSVVASVA